MVPKRTIPDAPPLPRSVSRLSRRPCFRQSDTAETSHQLGDWKQTPRMTDETDANPSEAFSDLRGQRSSRDADVALVIFTSGRTDRSINIGNDLDSATETRIQVKRKQPRLFIKLHTRDMTHIYMSKIHDVEETLSRLLKLPPER